jgi:Zn-dependent protease
MPDHFAFPWLRIGRVPVNVSGGYVATAIVFGCLAGRAFAHRGGGGGLIVAVGLAAAVVYTLSIVAHELGHLAAAALCRLDVRAVGLSATGGFVELADAEVPARSLALIAGAGPLVTALLALAASVLKAVEPTGDAAVDQLLTVLLSLNLAGLAVNLLPLRPLDGSHLLAAARLRHVRR